MYIVITHNIMFIIQESHMNEWRKTILDIFKTDPSQLI